jgi:hypothetical protein
MPRTLPWLTAPKSKPIDPLSTSSPAPPKRKRDGTPSSDQDLVDSDLNPTGVSTPQRRAKQRLLNPDRSPSTSPPPAPPVAEYMREGYGADDAWMMVEDEFAATAQLYTQHLHHAAYAEQKRRAQARGQKVLRTLGRPTDGRTERDGMAVEREERAMSIKKALGLDKEEEGDLTDPLLGALMNDPRRMGRALEGVGKMKSKSRAANGFLRSPEKARKTFVEDLGDDGGRDLDDDFSEADSDDLDGPVARPSKQSTVASYNASIKPTAPKPDPRRETSVFKKLAAAASDDQSRDRVRPDHCAARDPTESHHRKQYTDVGHTNVEASKNPFTTSIDDFETFQPSVKEEPSAYLIKRRQKKEEEEKRKAKEKKAAVEVPTFIIRFS